VNSGGQWCHAGIAPALSDDRVVVVGHGCPSGPGSVMPASIRHLSPPIRQEKLRLRKFFLPMTGFTRLSVHGIL
jgi:hypothetical protein